MRALRDALASPMRFRLAVAGIVLLQSLLIYVAVAQRFPTSGDDYSYLYQARLFADGKLYAQDPLYDYRNPVQQCIANICLRDENGRRFSKYAPGWSAVLSIGVGLKAPWLVQPLLAALLVFLILGYLERKGAAPWAGGILLMACAFYSYYGASYRPHLATALCIFAAFLAYERVRHEPQHHRASIALTGALLGLSALMRYVDWVPLGLWIAYGLWRGNHRRELTLFILCLGLVASGNAAWGWMLSGHPLTPPASLGGSDGHDQLRLSWDGFRVTLSRFALLC